MKIPHDVLGDLMALAKLKAKLKAGSFWSDTSCY